MNILDRVNKSRRQSSEGKLQTDINDRVYNSLIEEIRSKAKDDARAELQGEIDSIKNECEEYKSKCSCLEDEKRSAVSLQEQYKSVSEEHASRCKQLEGQIETMKKVKPDDGVAVKLREELTIEKQSVARLEMHVAALEGQLSVPVPQPVTHPPVEIPDFNVTVSDRNLDGKIKTVKISPQRLN